MKHSRALTPKRMRIKEQQQKADVHAPSSEEERDSEWPLPTELTRQRAILWGFQRCFPEKEKKERTGQSETQTNEKETWQTSGCEQNGHLTLVI